MSTTTSIATWCAWVNAELATDFELEDLKAFASGGRMKLYEMLKGQTVN